MRVLVFEQFHLGHHYHYLHHLLPPLIDLVDEVVVAVTEEGRRSEEFTAKLAPYLGRVAFDTGVPPADTGLPLRERWRVCRNLRAAVSRARPDYVLVPSGDGQSTVMPLLSLSGLGGLPNGCPAEVGIHYGAGRAARGLKGTLRNLYKEFQLLTAGWTRVHAVNLLLYEHLKARRGRLSDRLVLLPDPIPANPRLGKAESRRRLGIPADGVYLGVAGMIDLRKAVPELLAAFRAAAKSPDERLLLAGKIVKPHLGVIDREYGDMVREGQLVLLDQFLDETAFQTALTAMDVVCTPYPRHEHLSGVLLHGLAAGRPILANDQGWSRTIVRRFDAGWTCDVLNHQQLTETIRTALDRGNGYQESEATKRLLAFHSPDNFAGSWVQGIRAALGRPAPPGLRSWEWVAAAIPGDKRYVI